jgi:hypothetical protein
MSAAFLMMNTQQEEGKKEIHRDQSIKFLMDWGGVARKTRHLFFLFFLIIKKNNIENVKRFSGFFFIYQKKREKKKKIILKYKN